MAATEPDGTDGDDAHDTGTAGSTRVSEHGDHAAPATAARPWLLLGYLAVLGYALLAPFSFRWDGGFLAERAAGLLSIDALTPGDAVDAARNVVLLAGWGLLEVVTDRGRSTRRRIVAAVAGGAAIGLTAELVQLAIPVRTPSLLDAAMNAAGAGAGALAADAGLRALGRWRRRPTALGVPTAALALPYALAVLLEAAFPLLRSADAGIGSGGPVDRVVWSFRHFSWESLATLPLLDLLLFAPAGVLLAAAFWEIERTRDSAFRLAAWCGLGLALAGELAHAPLGIPMELGPLLVHAAGLLIGARIGARGFPRWLRRRRGRARGRDFLLGYVLLLALWRLRPFVPELDPGAVAAELSLSRWSPLAALGARRDLYSVSDVLRSFLLFVPVGLALASRQRTRSASPDGEALRQVGWIVALALLLEAGQAVVAGRFFDGTDLLVMAAGGFAARAVARRPW